MSTLFFQILLCLLLAFLIGLVIGCLICRISGRRRVRELEDEVSDLKVRLRNAEGRATDDAELASLKSDLEACRRRNGDLETRLASAEAGLSGDQGLAGMPLAAAGLLAMDEPAEPDDLTKIWGIGKKMNELLNGGQIFTFVKLANTTVPQLRAIIEAYGSERLSRLANEETWPEQAAMAARGEWDDLKAYQDKLSWNEGGK